MSLRMLARTRPCLYMRFACAYARARDLNGCARVLATFARNPRAFERLCVSYESSACLVFVHVRA